MELVSTQTSADGSGLVFSVDLDDGELLEPLPPPEVVDPVVELGLWLAGLNSFLSLSGQLFAGTAGANPRGDDYIKSFRLTYAALLQCSRLNIGLRRQIAVEGALAGLPASATEIDELALVLREMLLLNESFIKARSLGYGEWKAWKAVLADKLRPASAFRRLTAISGGDGLDVLPEQLRTVLLDAPETFPAGHDLLAMLPRVAVTLKTLGIVGRMLRNDEPLKPALLLFARVYEETRDLVAFVNNRLARYTDETTELFGMLDGASYTISMEIRKVYDDELKGVIGIRPAPTVYAKFEAAYSLMTETLQQLLAGFARLSDPSVTALDLFPNFAEKLGQSLIVRSEMWKMLQSVRAVEQSPESESVSALRKDLKSFLEKTIGYLFYKDTEALERFCEEIFATEDKKDLVPILHRFGAYIETLFGQVNMRAVLANHPFEP